MAKLLETYRKKRDFTRTAEPPPGAISKQQGFTFCVQKHDATRLHYDFRLELDGVLKSWAVTKGPSLDPADKRLAVRTEDHPLAYGGFEGTIPQGQYGGGTVMLWDEGHWEPIGDPHQGLEEGHLKFNLTGKRMQGRWVLVRMRGRPGEKNENWLLIKEDDDAAKPGDAGAFLENNAFSVKTRRTMDKIAAGHKVWQSRPAGNADDKLVKKKIEAKHKKAAQSLAVLTRTYKAPQLATLVDAMPEGGDWVHEIKFDGYRLLCYIAGGEVALRTRNGHDWTDRFPTVVEQLSRLEVEDAVLDGEAVVLDQNGRTDFQALQAALGEGGNPANIHIYLFDLLHLDGADLRKKPLLVRKEMLHKILADIDDDKSAVHYSEHMSEQPELLTKVCDMRLEGIISKKANAPYEMKRSKTWVKSKCGLRQEFVVVGYAHSKSGPRALGALHIAYNKDGRLHYAGKVGTGFTGASAREIRAMLDPLAIDKPAISDIPRTAQRGSVWVRPDLLCEVSFTEWTGEGHVRHPSFEGMRADKRPEEVTVETPVEVKKVEKAAAKTVAKPVTKIKRKAEENLVLRGVTITHPERQAFPDIGITKGELAEYYSEVAPLIMHEIRRHPLSLLRCPSGINGECFFQRNPDQYMRKVVTPFKWSHNENPHEYLYIEDEEGVVFLAQMGVIELHPWGASVDNIEYPVRMIFDLDPDPAVPFEAVKLGALDVRQRLKKLGLESFVKTTGGKGLHVIVPLDGKSQTWPQVKDWAAAFAAQMVRDVPDAYVATMTKAKRTGKIFVDYFRNDYTATAVAAYSVRARPGAPVAVPLDWEELEGLEAANAFSLKETLARIRTKKPDLRQYSLKQKLPELD